MSRCSRRWAKGRYRPKSSGAGGGVGLTLRERPLVIGIGRSPQIEWLSVGGLGGLYCLVNEGDGSWEQHHDDQRRGRETPAGEAFELPGTQSG